MNERARAFRSVALPIAVMGLAVAAPAAVPAVTADMIVEQTVRRAEALTQQLTESARELCRATQVASPAADLTGPPIAELPRAAAALAAPAGVSLPPIDRCLLQLIDLPPPANV